MEAARPEGSIVGRGVLEPPPHQLWSLVEHCKLPMGVRGLAVCTSPEFFKDFFIIK